MSTGRDETISGAKIQPLDSETKHNVEHDLSSRGAAGTDHNIDHARIEPLGGHGKQAATAPAELTAGAAPETSHLIHVQEADKRTKGQFQHPAPHANSQEVVGRDEAFAGAKIAPLDGKEGPTAGKSTGLDDEAVDGSRIAPLGEVREQMQ
ncbi:hypothetical protein SLS56_001259 [Neofusicoccum ribis]|uniref:Allergen n=1 Tax=Neofusicoccum ribis TaxID=45134 RepID=A0ABR3TA93_9PEZI